MKKTFSFILLASFIASCQKDGAKNTEPTKTDVLVQSSWKFDNAGIDTNKDGTIEFDISSQIQACLKDNTITFTKNNTGTVDEGPTKCDPASPQTLPITWSFADNETSMNLGGNAIVGVNGKFKLLALTKDKLTLAKDTTVPLLPGTVQLVANFKH